MSGPDISDETYDVIAGILIGEAEGPPSRGERPRMIAATIGSIVAAAYDEPEEARP